MVDQQSVAKASVSHGGFIKPWLWFGFALFAAMLAVALTLEVSAGESIRQINLGANLLPAALAAGSLTGLIWVCSVLRHRDDSGGSPVLLFFLAGGLGFILFTLLFYTVENYRGKRAWLECLHASKARGEKLTVAELAPPAVPDEENFAMQSIWVEAITAQLGAEKARNWYGDRVQAFVETNKARSLDLRFELPEVQSMTNTPVGLWQLAKPPDLTAWQDYYQQLAQRTNYFPIASNSQSAAEDVLFALSRNNDTIETLRRASQLPHARFPVSYGDENPADSLLPHLVILKECVSFLQLRASAELQAGKAESALEEIQLMLRLNDLVRDEPFFISHLVHIAMFQIEVQVMWQGLAEQRWNDTQLAQLDARLARLDFLKSYTNAMAGEKAFACQIVGYLKRNRRQLKPLGLTLPLPGNLGENETLLNCFSLAIPRGWFDQNRATIWRFYDEHLDHVIDVAHRTYSSSNAIQAVNAEGKLSTTFSPYNRLAAMLLPALVKGAKKFVFAQQTLDFVRLAIALERYRLAVGKFPDTLDALSPGFLVPIPHGIVSGEPLRYRRIESGGFVLYSVGWNCVDDGGKVAQTPNGRANPEAGDWVWQYPDAKQEP